MFALTFRVGHQLESAAPRIRNENERGAAPRRRAKNNHNGQVDGCLGAWMFGCADASGCLDGLFLSKITQTHACSGRANTNKNGINSLKTGTKCCSVFFFPRCCYENSRISRRQSSWALFRLPSLF